MLEAVDAELGRLIEALGPEASRTVFFVVGDNGVPIEVTSSALVVEELPVGRTATRLLESQGDRFKHSIWESGVRVPLIVSGPIVGAPGRSQDALVDAPDLFATLRDLFGASADLPGGVDGVSFMPALRSPEPEGWAPREFSYVERFHPGGDPRDILYAPGEMSKNYHWRRGFVLETDAGRFKLVRNLDENDDPDDKLFQLSDASGAEVDPWELEPLDLALDENRVRVELLREALDRLIASEPRDG
jgi:arylsulfatase A-like enzyme